MRKVCLLVMVLWLVLSVQIFADNQQLRSQLVQQQQARINYISQLQQQKQKIDIEIQAQRDEILKLQGKIDLLDEQDKAANEKDSTDIKVEENKK